MNKPFRFQISKTSQRHLDKSVMNTQIDRIIGRMLASGRDTVWAISARPVINPLPTTSETYVYQMDMTIKRIGRTIAKKDVFYSKIAYMLRIGQAAANASAWVFPASQNTGLPEVTKVEAAEAKAEEESRVEEGEKEYSPVKMNTDVSVGFFDHIYERDAQISVVQSAVDAFVQSDFNNRFHCVLYGEPACGKTEILKSFTAMLGKNFVLELDATSTTKAGAERILLESANLPPVLVCEEIEKTDESSLRWLLGILDHRGEVRKVTHGGGLRHRDVKMLCLATVNDMELFKRVMDGALASRFSHKVWCPRPSKDVLGMILRREIAKVKDGREEWIAPAVDWCVDIEGTNDPRRVVTVCLSGKERLLTGEYQKLLQAVSGPKSAERKTDAMEKVGFGEGRK